MSSGFIFRDFLYQPSSLIHSLLVPVSPGPPHSWLSFSSKSFLVPSVLGLCHLWHSPLPWNGLESFPWVTELGLIVSLLCVSNVKLLCHPWWLLETFSHTCVCNICVLGLSPLPSGMSKTSGDRSCENATIQYICFFKYIFRRISRQRIQRNVNPSACPLLSLWLNDDFSLFLESCKPGKCWLRKDQGNNFCSSLVCAVVVGGQLSGVNQKVPWHVRKPGARSGAGQGQKGHCLYSVRS